MSTYSDHPVTRQNIFSACTTADASIRSETTTMFSHQETSGGVQSNLVVEE